MLVLSVLAHELRYRAVALCKGIPVHGITFSIFGGVSRLGQEPETPRIEFIVSLVGPVTSIITSVIFGLAWYMLCQWDPSLDVVLLLVACTNLGLGVPWQSFRRRTYVACGNLGMYWQLL